jgi:hypothetical protein
MDVSKLKNRPLEHLLYLGFNQNYGCLAVGTTKGFMIFNNIPYRENIKRRKKFNKVYEKSI